MTNASLIGTLSLQGDVLAWVAGGSGTPVFYGSYDLVGQAYDRWPSLPPGWANMPFGTPCCTAYTQSDLHGNSSLYIRSGHQTEAIPLLDGENFLSADGGFANGRVLLRTSHPGLQDGWAVFNTTDRTLDWLFRGDGPIDNTVWGQPVLAAALEGDVAYLTHVRQLGSSFNSTVREYDLLRGTNRTLMAGETAWTVLHVSPKYVLATDNGGRGTILQRRTGQRLAVASGFLPALGGNCVIFMRSPTSARDPGALAAWNVVNGSRFDVLPGQLGDWNLREWHADDHYLVVLVGGPLNRPEAPQEQIAWRLLPDACQ